MSRIECRSHESCPSTATIAVEVSPASSKRLLEDGQRGRDGRTCHRALGELMGFSRQAWRGFPRRDRRSYARASAIKVRVWPPVATLGPMEPVVWCTVGFSPATKNIESLKSLRRLRREEQNTNERRAAYLCCCYMLPGYMLAKGWSSKWHLPPTPRKEIGFPACGCHESVWQPVAKSAFHWRKCSRSVIGPIFRACTVLLRPSQPQARKSAWCEAQKFSSTCLPIANNAPSLFRSVMDRT